MKSTCWGFAHQIESPIVACCISGLRQQGSWNPAYTTGHHFNYYWWYKYNWLRNADLGGGARRGWVHSSMMRGPVLLAEGPSLIPVIPLIRV